VFVDLKREVTPEEVEPEVAEEAEIELPEDLVGAKTSECLIELEV